MTMMPACCSLVEDPYRDWAPFYPPTAHNLLMQVEQRAMLSLLPDIRGARVLDAGSGTGRYAELAAARGAGRVICVDRSPSMLARTTSASHQVRADFADLPLASGSIDLVVSGLALMDAPDLGRLFVEWSRMLRPQGVVLCSTLHPRGEVLGWTRTFATPAGSGRLPTHWHSLAAFRSACAGATLELDAVVEPSHASAPGEPCALIVRAHLRG